MALDHYVSQVHLKRFYSPDLDGLMYALRKSDLKHYTPNAKAVCRTDEGNTNAYLSEPRAIEKFLKTVEGNYNTAVKQLVANDFDEHTIYTISGFASYVMCCAPAGMRLFGEPIRGATELGAKLIDSMIDLPPPPPQLGSGSFSDLLDSGAIQLKIDEKYPQAIGIANITRQVAVFGNFPWEILINEQESTYFTSDYPVAIETTADPRIVNRIIPLTPTVAVRIMPNFDLDRRSADYDFKSFRLKRRIPTRQEVLHINRLIVRSAEDSVFFSKNAPWVQPFVQSNRHFRVGCQLTHVPTERGTMQIARQMILSHNQ